MKKIEILRETQSERKRDTKRKRQARPKNKEEQSKI